ncbi:MAG: hypothetical protein ACP5H2_11290 [Solirubrobacteraceae bacterium]
MNIDHDEAERERRVLDLLRAVREETRAPATLRAEIQALQSSAQLRPSRKARLTTVIAAAAATVTAAVTATVLVAGTTTPSLAAVVALAARPATGSAPLPDRAHPRSLLRVHVGAVHFPDWQADAGWTATGRRSDLVDGRRVLTVYYRHGRNLLAYSIVTGPVLAGSSAAGRTYVVRRQAGQVSVIWPQAGHTCVLSSSTASVAALWTLAQSAERQAARWVTGQPEAQPGAYGHDTGEWSASPHAP